MEGWREDAERGGEGWREVLVREREGFFLVYNTRSDRENPKLYLHSFEMPRYEMSLKEHRKS